MELYFRIAQTLAADVNLMLCPKHSELDRNSILTRIDTRDDRLLPHQRTGYHPDLSPLLVIARKTDQLTLSDQKQHIAHLIL